MSYSSFLYEVADGIASVRLNDPETLNALTFETSRNWNGCLMTWCMMSRSRSSFSPAPVRVSAPAVTCTKLSAS